MPAAFLPIQPAAAAEIGERALSIARLGRSGSRATLLGFYTGELPEGAIRASAIQPNVADAAAVRAHVREAKARVAPSGGPIALCLPDPVARVSLLQLDAMPARDAEVLELVSWRLKKQLPYRVEEASVAWKALGARGGATNVLAAAIRRRVLQEYEDLLEAEGFEVGSVTTSTLAMAEALPVGGGDALLVNCGDGWFSLLWTDGEQPVLLRTKQLPASDREGEARDAAIAAELAPTIEYATGRLQRSASVRVLVHDASGRSEDVAARIESGGGLQATVLRATPAAALPPAAADRLGAACALALRGLGDSVTLEAAS